jgi:hypothetical protein
MDKFNLDRYSARKKFWKLFGGEVRIFDENRQQLLFFVKQKAFKLKEDITVFSDESQREEVMKIKARSILDFGTTYDITDAASKQKVGALRRKGFRSMFRDSWLILDANDREIGSVQEDNMLLALLRRFLSNLIPQSFDITVGETTAGKLHQAFNPFVPQFTIDFSMDQGKKLDRRLGIGAVILLQIIEGRQG